MPHKKKVTDTDAFFVVDAITRQIKNMTPAKILLIQHDHNSERFTFSIPRFIEGHDMMESTKAEVHFINVSATKQTSSGVYGMADIKLDLNTEGNITCSWILSRNATKYAGKLSFMLRFICMNGDDVAYVWNTATFTGISIGEGLDCAETFEEEYLDIIEQWKEKTMKEIQGMVTAAIELKGDWEQIDKNKKSIEDLQANQSSLQNQFNNVLHGVTEDSEVIDARIGHDGAEYPTIGEAIRRQIDLVGVSLIQLVDAAGKIEEKADESERLAIVQEASGRNINVKDSAAARLRSMSIFGRTEQKTTTGKNLFQFRQGAIANGTIIENFTNGSIVVGNQHDSAANGAYARGWFRPGVTDASGNGILIQKGQNISISADVTLLETGNANTQNIMGIIFLPRGSTGKQYSTAASVALTKDKKTRISCTYNITEDAPDILYFPVFSVNSNKVRIEDIQIEVSDAATEYEPYTGGIPAPNPDFPQALKTIGSSGVISFEAIGKNLLREDLFPKTQTANGITSDYEGNGIFHIHGTFNGDVSSFQLSTTELHIPVEIGTKYTLSVKLLSGSVPKNFYPYLGIGSDSIETKNWFSCSMNADTKIGAVYTNTKKPEDALSDAKFASRFWIYTYNAELEEYTADFRFQVWLERNDTGTGYAAHESKKGTVYLPNFLYGYGLYGIPVKQGGNYTDANGQQWVCDEIDLKNKKYIQRVMVEDVTFSFQSELNRYTATLTHSANAIYADGNGIPVICDKLRFDPMCGSGNPVVNGVRVATTSPRYVIAYHDGDVIDKARILYPLDEPIENELTAADSKNGEILFDEWSSFKPDTNFVNDSDAYMNVGYAADTKKYIDNKFAELQALILDLA